MSLTDAERLGATALVKALQANDGPAFRRAVRRLLPTPRLPDPVKRPGDYLAAKLKLAEVDVAAARDAGSHQAVVNGTRLTTQLASELRSFAQSIQKAKDAALSQDEQTLIDDVVARIQAMPEDIRGAIARRLAAT